MTNLPTLEMLRPCGLLENFSTSRHHLGLYKNVGLTATYIVSKTTRWALEETIHHALRQVVLELPNLSAIALHEDQSSPGVHFARLPEIDLRKCVTIRKRNTPPPRDGEQDQELDELLAEEHSHDFKVASGAQPFWRLVVLDSQVATQTFTATWIFHHALSDGASAIIFHKSLLNALNAPDSSVTHESIINSPGALLVPSLEELHSMSISWPFFLKAILGALVPSIFARRPARIWTGKPVPSSTASLASIKLRTLVLPAERTKELVSVSRREKTSVTATMQCILAISLFANLPSAEYEKLKIEGPVSLRRFLDIDENQMINAISQYGYMHMRSSQALANAKLWDDFSWDEARKVKTTIQSEISNEGRDNPIALLKYVSDMSSFFLEKLGKERDSSAELSNLGICKFPQVADAGWHIGRMTFSQSLNVTSSALAVNVVTGGDLNAVINFCWSSDTLEDGMMEKVIEDFMQGIQSIT